MNERIINIYKALYSDLNCTKETLANYLNVASIKTVENNIKEIDDIEYDIKLRKYRFKELLPKYIPNEIFFNIFKSSIVNKLLKNDFLLLEKDMPSIKTNNMMRTCGLSKLSKKIIMFKNAIKNNCVLKVEYKTEQKWIRAHSIFSTGFTYYVYVTYDDRNPKNIGEERTFAFNSIGNIEVVEYLNNTILQKEQKGNAFGAFKKDMYVILNLDAISASYFKREIIFNDDAYEQIDENEVDKSITVKLYYNNIEKEIVPLIQRWIPHITIEGDSHIKNLVYDKIQSNYKHIFKDS